jgi:hypothetical protein
MVRPLLQVVSDFDNVVTIPSRTSASNSTAATGFRCRRFGVGIAFALHNGFALNPPEPERLCMRWYATLHWTPNSLAPSKVPDASANVDRCGAFRPAASRRSTANAPIRCYKPMNDQDFPLS